jgi:predicted ATPase
MVFEREAEVDHLGAALDAAGAGTGRFVLVEGPAGVGKTSLLRIAVEEARQRGLPALTAAARELEQSFAFGVTLQLFARPYSELSASRRRDVARGAARLALPLLETGEPEHDLHSVVHGLHWLAANLASEAGLAIVVADVQWADDPSLRLVSYLLGRL